MTLLVSENHDWSEKSLGKVSEFYFFLSVGNRVYVLCCFGGQKKPTKSNILKDDIVAKWIFFSCVHYCCRLKC